MEKERHEGPSRHADDAELNGEQKAKGLWNNPPTAFLTSFISAHGDRNTPARRTASGPNRDIDGTERRFWTELPSRKIRVQSKNKKRKRPGQIKVHSRQETVVYFPKSVNESTDQAQWKFRRVTILTDTDSVIVRTSRQKASGGAEIN